MKPVLSNNRPAPPSKSNGAAQQPTRTLGTSKGLRQMGRKIVLYGPGKIGKSKLVSLLSQLGINVLFADIEEGTSYLDVNRVDPTPANYEELRATLHNKEMLNGVDAICIDSLTRAEELSTSFVIANVPHEKGHMVTRIEDFGFGKGYVHIYEAMLCILGDLDAIARSGKHVICICHDVTESVPNPSGENYLQYQPRLQSPPKAGKTRERVREWADDLLYIGWDLIVTDGKGQGGGSRTIYPVQYASHWAGSRTLSEPIVYHDNDPELWNQLFNKE